MSLLAAGGLLLALTELHVTRTVVTFFFAFAVSLSCLAALAHEPTGPPLDWSRARFDAVRCACAFVGLPPAFDVSPSGALCLLAACVLSSPSVIARVGLSVAGVQHGPSEPAPSRDQRVTQLLEVGPCPRSVSQLDTPTLCRAWRRSFAMLSAAETATERSIVVELRQLYLDELERRHPQSLASWLETRPAPSSGPEAYLPR